METAPGTRSNLLEAAEYDRSPTNHYERILSDTVASRSMPQTLTRSYQFLLHSVAFPRKSSGACDFTEAVSVALKKEEAL